MVQSKSLHRAHLMTVGVISAQKKMLRLLTAWEENMPMMEKAMEKFLFRVSEFSAGEKADSVKNNPFVRKT